MSGSNFEWESVKKERSPGDISGVRMLDRRGANWEDVGVLRFIQKLVFSQEEKDARLREAVQNGNLDLTRDALVIGANTESKNAAVPSEHQDGVAVLPDDFKGTDAGDTKLLVITAVAQVPEATLSLSNDGDPEGESNETPVDEPASVADPDEAPLRSQRGTK